MILEDDTEVRSNIVTSPSNNQSLDLFTNKPPSSYNKFINRKEAKNSSTGNNNPNKDSNM